MKVYIAIKGLYDDKSIAGVYATPEAAMAAMPGTTWTLDDSYGIRDWTNELDWDDSVHITEADIEGT